LAVQKEKQLRWKTLCQVGEQSGTSPDDLTKGKAAKIRKTAKLFYG